MTHAQLRAAGVEVPPKQKGGRAATSAAVAGDAATVGASLVLAYCRARGYPDPVTEHDFHPTREWRFDLAWPERMVALEVEGVTGGGGGRHQRLEGYEGDCQKYNAALLLGWRVVRVTPRMIRDGRVYQYLDALLGFHTLPAEQVNEVPNG